MADQDDNQCGHALCTCTAAPDSAYCSSHCEAAEASGTTTIACDCGHTGCGAEITT